MRKFILSGGGDGKQTLEINKEFAQRMNKTKPLLYLPIAGDAEHRSYESGYEYVISIFKPLGIVDITMWMDVENKTIEDLLQFSAVYISGGNTYKLLNDFKSAGFDEVLKQYIENGGMIYGQSAGAIIFGSYLIDSSGATGKGLNLVENYSFWCHYEKEDDLMIEQFVKKDKHCIISLPEGTAAFVRGSEIEILGTKPAYVFEGKAGDAHVISKRQAFSS